MKRPVLSTATTSRKLVISGRIIPKQHCSNTGNKPLRGNSLPGRTWERLKKPLACNSAYSAMDVVTSKASHMGTQAVPNQVDILKLEEGVFLQGKENSMRV